MLSAENLQPVFSSDTISACIQSVYGKQVVSVQNLGSYFDQNFLIVDQLNEKFIFKIHDITERREVLDMQNQAIARVASRIVSVDFPLVQATIDGSEIGEIQDSSGRNYWMRLLHYIDGELLADRATPCRSIYTELGITLGKMDLELQSFNHIAAYRPDTAWDLKNALLAKKHLPLIGNPEIRRIADYYFMLFESEVQPILGDLRKSVVHQDTHRYSVLVNSNDRVTGIIDFGDTVHTATIFNLSVAAYDAILDRTDGLDMVAALVKGYHSEYPLTGQEISLMYFLIGARLAVYTAMAAHFRVTQPDNVHAQLKSKSVSAALKYWISVNPARAEDTLRRACTMPSILPTETDLNNKITKREEHFPTSLYTHYERPLYLERGALQYLHDAMGHTYLDCVNNVCQWGHCHPTIARAIQHQVTKLNTNSRYIYDVMAEYADRLTATMPDPLSVCFFVNSGSEANDLALRLAHAYTGQRDVIVVDKAYHGNSDRCTEISPHRIDRPGKPGLPAHVHKIMVPDAFRGPYKGADAGKKYAADVVNVLENITNEKRGVSAFIAESLVGTGGQIVLPGGYLEQVYKHIRNSGGVCVADEVQMGFGRIGTHIWCFESQNVIPDIVTMGKPIANGHPMAAVVTTPEIAAAFNNGVSYFNTFGGNPVSCVAGLAVLDILDSENILANVSALSEKLFLRLRELQDKYDCIADVRGLGLYVGVELVTDAALLTPAPRLAKQVVEQLKGMGILLNTNGYDNNIIKIKPPLIIGCQDIDRLVDSLDEVLASLILE